MTRRDDSDRPGPVRPAVLVSVALLSTLIPFLLNWNTVGVADFDQFATFNQIALWWHALGDYTVTWDPFLCGGATLVGNPQVPLFHPNLPLFWLFGPVNGLGLSFIPWAIVGFVGMLLLARDSGLGRASSAWVAVAWVLNGFFIGQLGSMHAQYTAFYLVPLLFLLNIRIARDGYWGALAALPFTLVLPCLYNHHFLAYAFPFVVGHFLVELIVRPIDRSVVRKAGLYFVAIGLTLGMLALFMLPSLAWNAEFPRFKSGEFEPPLNLVQMLLLPIQIIPFDVKHDMFERYYTLGPVLFAILVAALVRGGARRRSIRGMLIVTVVAFVTAIGSFEPLGWPTVSLFDFLRGYVPGYQAIRVPSRFFINGIPALLLLIGFEWQRRAENWSPGRRASVAAAALVPLWIFNFAYLQFSLFSQERAVYRPQPAAMSSNFSWAEPGFRFRMMRKIAPDVGVLDCYEALEVPKAAALDVARGFVLAADFEPRIERVHWGQFVLTAPAAMSGEIAFNFNHHRGWQVEEVVGGSAEVVSSDRQPLTLRLEAATRVRLVYVTPIWFTGVRVSLIALVLAGLYAIGCLLMMRRQAHSSSGS